MSHISSQARFRPHVANLQDAGAVRVYPTCIDAEDERMRRVQMPTVISKDGTRIAFEKSGKGAPVVLVGGVLGDRSPQAPLAALLADQFTVYNSDRRGRGESGFTAPYAVEREIEDLAAILAEAGGSACVYGTSGLAALSLLAAAH